MIDAHRIVYNNLGTEEFDVTPHLFFDSDSGTTDTFLNRDIVSTSSYDGSRKYIHGATYTDSATPRFTLIKTDFSDLTPEENRRILSWLTSLSKPSWLEVYQDDSNAISYKYLCIPANIEQYKLSNGRVVGIEFDIVSSSPYAFSRNFIYPEVHETVAEISSNNLDNDWVEIRGTKTFTINCETDEYSRLLYPKVTIQFDGDEYIVKDEWNEGKDTLHNVIYRVDDKYYINIPNVFIGDIDSVFSSAPKDTEIESKYVINNSYHYFRNDKAIYRAIRICKKATDYNSDTTYYIDNKGLIKADPQPISDMELQSNTYYVQSQDDNGSLFAWEFVASVGTGIRIENTSVKNSLNANTTTEIIGCTATFGDSIGEEIVLDGTNKVISSSIKKETTFGRTFGNDFNWVWPPFAYGENNFTIIGNCRMRFEWIEPRKVGSL